MTHYRQLIDADLTFLSDLCGLVDDRLEEVYRQVRELSEPDRDGDLDLGEYMVGIAFIACDNYMIEVVAKKKNEQEKRRALGPRCRGISIAQIVHAAASYAKHNAEPLADPKALAILRKFDLLRSEPDRECEFFDYPLANLLYRLLEPEEAFFRNLLALLVQWRDEVIEKGLA